MCRTHPRPNQPFTQHSSVVCIALTFCAFELSRSHLRKRFSSDPLKEDACTILARRLRVHAFSAGFLLASSLWRRASTSERPASVRNAVSHLSTMRPPDIFGRTFLPAKVIAASRPKSASAIANAVTFIPPLALLSRIRRVTTLLLTSAAITLAPLCRAPAKAASVSEAQVTNPNPVVIFDRDYANKRNPFWDHVGFFDQPRESVSTPDPQIQPQEQRVSAPELLQSPTPERLEVQRKGLCAATKRVLLEDEVRILCRLLVALTVGGIIGVERRAAKSFAGVRTFSLVSLGAAIFMSTALVAFPNADPARVAAAISSSVGFLGAGVMSKNSKHSRGLTTASSVWLAAALGIAAASGLFVLSYTGAIMTVLIARYARFDNSLHLIRGDPLDSPDPLYEDLHEPEDDGKMINDMARTPLAHNAESNGPSHYQAAPQPPSATLGGQRQGFSFGSDEGPPSWKDERLTDTSFENSRETAMGSDAPASFHENGSRGTDFDSNGSGPAAKQDQSE